MKTIKQRTLAVAVCLACGVTGAQAAISNGAATAGGSNQDGELFLNVWDQLSSTSYALDLGTTINAMYTTQNSSHVWQLDQSFINWAALNPTDTLTFNVAGDNSYVGKNSILDSVVLSSRTGYTNTINVSMTSIATLQANVAARALALNVASGEPFNTVDPTLNNYAANSSSISVPGDGQPYFNYSTWGTTEGIVGYVGSATVRNGGADQTLDLIDIHSPGGTVLQSTPAKVEKLNGYLTLDVSAATLTWHTNAVTAVPLPGAVWLFLSGLLATLGFQKRKSHTLAA